MGTHPIFESDFDCLTEMDIFHVISGVKKIVAKSAHFALKKQAAACTRLSAACTQPVQPDSSFLGEGAATQIYFSRKNEKNLKFKKSEILLKSAPDIQIYTRRHLSISSQI